MLGLIWKDQENKTFRLQIIIQIYCDFMQLLVSDIFEHVWRKYILPQTSVT